MLSILVDENETIEITFAVAKTENGRLKVAPSKAELSPLAAEEQRFVFRRPSYADESEINDGAILIVDGKPVIRPASLRLKRMAVLLKSWGLTDAKGKWLPINVSTVGSLDPVVADYVSDRLETEIGIE